jgi:hypothetical protein
MIEAALIVAAAIIIAACIIADRATPSTVRGYQPRSTPLAPPPPPRGANVSPPARPQR